MKYIIDIPDGIKWGVVTCRTEGGFYTRDFDFLEELNSDYINEHFSDLQDDAYQKGLEDGKQTAVGAAELREKLEYQKGFEDGKAIHEKGCEGCEYTVMGSDTAICSQCCNAYHNQWTAKDDKIEVGDEVVTQDGKRFVVTTFGSSFDGDIAVGVCADGLGLGIDIRELHKTGRHFDIASILEEMRK